ncbi:MAG: TraR/DksA C4-type zinc finger protein [Gammaproteobacteria bacterium]|nr:TraR/DksA C4-type zinc finger protein [Gammaproteobacteria bacterium]
MTEVNTEKARAKLLRLQNELEDLVADSKDSAAIVELDQSKVGRLSRMDAMQGQAMAQASVQRQEAMLRGIAAALQRIDDGVYGLCLDCDEPIAGKRLEFDPTVSRCVGCESKREQD